MTVQIAESMTLEINTSSPYIGIGPSPFAAPYPSSLVSTPAPITSVDSG